MIFPVFFRLTGLMLLLSTVLPIAADTIVPSMTRPEEGTPEHKYFMYNAQGYYVTSKLSPTKTATKRGKFAFYSVKDIEGAYYIYDITAAQWVSYAKAASYNNQVGFLTLTPTQTEGAYFKLEKHSDDAYQISPYNTMTVSKKYLNWFRGIGADNPLDGTVTLGLWQDRGSQDAGSSWKFTEVDNVKEYTLFSAGMPSTAVITIHGVQYKGVNAQGDTKFQSGTLENSDVSVVCGGGYGYMVQIDNANKQVNVDFVQMFTPTLSINAETQHPYLLKMPAAYISHSGSNLVGTTKKSASDRILFIEDPHDTGRYYIYNLTTKSYISYSNIANGSLQTDQTNSNVKLVTAAGDAKTWQILLRSDRESVSIIPGSVASVNSDTPAWNFTGGITYNAVLNLWRADDSNSAWTIIDPTVGSLPCATTLFSLPGKEFMHKIVTNTDETVQSIDFGSLKDLQLKDDRIMVGNNYKYVHGTAPKQEGEYTYLVKIATSDGSVSTVPVRLTVSRHLPSPTPMMGWLSWNWFAKSISHEKIVAIAQGMQDKGLFAAGYNTIVLDDGWATPQKNKAKLTYDPAKFPYGIKGLKTALRSINSTAKLGIYSDAGSMTCENYQPGSYGYEAAHMKLFDNWEVDMLKYDFCNSEDAAYVSYKTMGKAIKQINDARAYADLSPFSYNICEWGSNQPWKWGAEAGGNSWRATADARESWIGNHSRPGVLGGVDEVRTLWMYAGVNRFNDLDMMCIGLHGLGGPSNNTATHQQNGGIIKGLTDAQSRSQMSLWCMLSSPLALTCDLRATPKGEANNGVALPHPLITETDIATLTNADIIAINQDALGQQAEYMTELSTGLTNFSNTGYDVYVKDLTGGRKAIAITNRGATPINSRSLNLTKLYLKSSTVYVCKNVWEGTDSEVTNFLPTGALAPYETKVFILTEKSSATNIAPVFRNTNNKNASVYNSGHLYDLTGNRVHTTTSGVYLLENGKKIIR